MSNEHAHEPLMYRRVRLDGGERLVETCACGATRSTDRGPTRVEWSPWSAPATTDTVVVEL